MMFSSRPPFNDDPQPYRQMMAFARAASRESASAQHAWVYDPRPEFDRPQHNPTNPILSMYRVSVAEGDDDAYESAWSCASGWTTHFPATQRQRDHARRVLTRLANLSNGDPR